VGRTGSTAPFGKGSVCPARGFHGVARPGVTTVMIESCGDDSRDRVMTALVYCNFSGHIIVMTVGCDSDFSNHWNFGTRIDLKKVTTYAVDVLEDNFATIVND
jgi:hypothetical protein